MSEKDTSPATTSAEKMKTNGIQRLKNMSNKKIALVIVELFLAISIFIALVFLVLFGIKPCRFKTCHANATCIDQSFNAKCKCNYGFNGNGFDCDECGLAYPLDELDTHGYDFNLGGFGFGFPTFSYPATVTIAFDYTTNIVVNNKSYLLRNSKNCIGALINRRSIITAASCLPKMVHFSPNGFANDTIDIPIVVNDNYATLQSIYNVYLAIDQLLSFYVDMTPTQTAVIDKIIIHSSYNDSMLDNDIAIIKLKNSVNLTQYVQLACIPDEYDLPYQSQYLKYGTKGFTLGYNIMYNKKFVMRYFLNEYSVTIFNLTTCSDQFPINNTDQLLCAGTYISNPTHLNGQFCQGDMGSPLYINRTVNGRVKNFAVGLVINDTSCTLGAYTNLFGYVGWINENSYY